MWPICRWHSPIHHLPQTSLHNLCHTLDEFTQISGLQVKYSKSQALNISLSSDTVALLRKFFKFEWSESSIKYLGINLTAKTEALYARNYPPMYHKLESDHISWSKNNLSWVGRIKMTLLPRLLYLFRSLPILIKKDHIKSFQSRLLKFTWGKSGYRIHQQTLYLHRKKGGLGLPQLPSSQNSSTICNLFQVRETGLGANRKTGSTPIHLGLSALEPPKTRPPIMAPTLSHTFTLWDSLWSLPAGKEYPGI